MTIWKNIACRAGMASGMRKRPSAFLLAFLLMDKRDGKLFLCFYVPGMLLSLMHFFASDLPMWGAASGMIPATCVSVCFVVGLAGELFTSHKLFVVTERPANSRNLRAQLNRSVTGAGSWSWAAAGMAVSMTAWCVGYMGYARMTSMQRDFSLAHLTTRIESGSAAGLYTHPKRAARYAAIRETLIRHAQPGKFLYVLDLLPWAYIDCPMRQGGFTAWRVFSDDTRFEPYYRLHPDRLPAVILSLNPSDLYLDIAYHDYNISPTGEINAPNSYLATYIRENDFDVHILDFGVVFCKRP